MPSPLLHMATSASLCLLNRRNTERIGWRFVAPVMLAAILPDADFLPGLLIGDPLDPMLYADTQVRLSDHPVMILDRMTMADGLEVRAPFMGHEIAQFAARLPVRLKVRGQCTRYLQRRLEEKYLQDSVLNQPKQGFQSALPYMLKHKYELLTGLFLRDSQFARDGILLQQPMDRLVQQHRIGKADHGNRLWLLLNSTLWYRIHIQGTTVADLSAQIQDSAHTAARGVPA